MGVNEFKREWRKRVENFLGDDVGVAREYANYHNIGGKDQWDETTAPVGSLKPNGYGLHDMADNAWNGIRIGMTVIFKSTVLCGSGA